MTTQIDRTRRRTRRHGGPSPTAGGGGRSASRPPRRAGRVRDIDYTTLSGMSVDPVYGPGPGDVVADFERIGWPGEFPFTRGLHATGYRGKPWTIRQFAGFGNAAGHQRRATR